MADQYPKMLTGATKDALGRTILVPLIYPPNVGHPRQGSYVIFQNAIDEANYDGSGVAAAPVSNTRENHNH
jgi:hypothetical protein